MATATKEVKVQAPLHRLFGAPLAPIDDN